MLVARHMKTTQSEARAARLKQASKITRQLLQKGNKSKTERRSSITHGIIDELNQQPVVPRSAS